MPDLVRFEHEYIDALKRFQITSPDIKGFYITGSTMEEVEREALAMLALMHAKQDIAAKKRLTSVTFSEAA